MTKKHNQQNPKLILEKFLPYRLSKLAQKISSTLATIYQQKHDVSIPEWRILATLNQTNVNQTGSLTSKEIATRTSMDKVKVSRAIHSLLKKKWIKKNNHATDNRAYIIHLSAKGQQVVDSMTPDILDWHNQLLSTLNKKERETLMTIIEKFDHYFEQHQA